MSHEHYPLRDDCDECDDLRDEYRKPEYREDAAMTEETKQGEPLTFDPNSSRPCGACGHAVPHSRGEYEDTHLRCMEAMTIRSRGADCAHRRYSKRCDEGGAQYGCYSYETFCDCSEEDRLIADLRAQLSTLRTSLQMMTEERDAAREAMRAIAADRDNRALKHDLRMAEMAEDLRYALSTNTALTHDLKSAESRAQKAMEAVRKYKAQHIGDCLAGVCAECTLPEEEHPTTATVYEGYDPSLPPHNFDPMDPCTCGLSEVLREGESNG